MSTLTENPAVHSTNGPKRPLEVYGEIHNQRETPAQIKRQIYFDYRSIEDEHHRTRMIPIRAKENPIELTLDAIRKKGPKPFVPKANVALSSGYYKPYEPIKANFMNTSLASAFEDDAISGITCDTLDWCY